MSPRVTILIPRSLVAGCLLVLAAPGLATAQSSGLLIGVNVVEQPTGLQVVSVIPNTPAVGRLQPGDVLRFITAVGKPVYSAHKREHLEKAKTALGPGATAALQIHRPGVGDKFFAVTFIPVGGTVPGSGGAPVSVETLGIQDVPPPSVPAVAQMFNGPAPSNPIGVPPTPPGGNASLGDLFGTSPGTNAPIATPPKPPGANASLEDLFK
ncbi:MAG: PDZ domain-containing protein [Isosphaeraceae bacterium]